MNNPKFDIASFPAEAWVTCLAHVARHYGIPFSAQGALTAAAWAGDRPEDEKLRLVARNLGLRVKTASAAGFALHADRLPLVARTDEGKLVVLVSMSTDGRLGVLLEDETDETILDAAVLLPRIRDFIIPRPLRTLVDARVDDYIAPYREGWLRRFAFPDLRPYAHVMLASATANVLGLTGIIFSKQVYDRVVPAESFSTLYVLFIGVMLALAFDFIMRATRTSIVDILGKRADMRLSDHVFGHALRVKNTAKPKSTGSFIAQLRDLDTLRESMTSSTVAVISDLPFLVLFLGFFWYIGGSLVIVPAVALLLMVLPGILAQKRLHRYVNEGMREGSMRNAMLIEAVQGLDDIKMMQAEDRFQQRWNHFNAVTAEAQLKQRGITSGLQAWAQVVQMGVFATIIFVGAPMVIAGTLSTGTLVACSILGSRMMAPMAQVTQIFSRMQQTKLSHQSVDGLLRMAPDRPARESRIGVASLRGQYEFRNVDFYRDAEQSQLAMSIPHLVIPAGEKVALLGRIGSGKSTLLQAMAGLMEQGSGTALLDDMALNQIDSFDLRRDVGLLTQESRLFHGTIRENLLMAAPLATDAQIMEALTLSGAAEFVNGGGQGLDYQLLENGRGLSGGQRQALLLARLFLRDPQIVLLDEPTAAMDEQSERKLVEALGRWGAGRTMIIATHRMRMLDIVDRVIVMENGRINFNGTKAAFLQRAQPAKPVARPVAGQGVRVPVARKAVG